MSAMSDVFLCGGSYSEDIIKTVDGNCSIFYIRAIHSASMYSRIQDIRKWRRVEIGSQETEVATVMSTQFMEDSRYRIVVQRTKEKDNTPDLFGDRYTYRCIITREECYRNVQQAWGERARLRPSQQWLRMEASAMLLLEREHRVHDTDSLLHEFLHVFHKSVIRIHQLIAYVKSQEVCLPLYRRMRQMAKDGKKLVAEFVYRHAVWQTFFWIDPFFSRLLNLNPQWGKGRRVQIWTSLDFFCADMRMHTIKIRKDFVC